MPQVDYEQFTSSIDLDEIKLSKFCQAQLKQTFVVSYYMFLHSYPLSFPLSKGQTSVHCVMHLEIDLLQCCIPYYI